MDEYLDNKMLFGEELRNVLADDIPKMMRISFYLMSMCTKAKSLSEYM
jgi:hypothetical protein